MPKPPIQMPITATEAYALQAWAESVDDRPRPASMLQITKHLTFMAATLPSKNLDEESGKMRVAVYSSILRDYSNEAIAYMARRACQQLDWFPTPRQCLELIGGYRPPVTEKDEALMLCHNYWHGKFDEFMDYLKAGGATQEMVDAVPRRWRLIAMERGYLRHLPDGDRFVIRDQRIGVSAA